MQTCQACGTVYLARATKCVFCGGALAEPDCPPTVQEAGGAVSLDAGAWDNWRASATERAWQPAASDLGDAIARGRALLADLFARLPDCASRPPAVETRRALLRLALLHGVVGTVANVLLCLAGRCPSANMIVGSAALWVLSGLFAVCGLCARRRPVGSVSAATLLFVAFYLMDSGGSLAALLLSAWLLKAVCIAQLVKAGRCARHGL